MDDSRIVDSLDRKDQSFGTGCDDHAVRLLFFDKLRSYLTVHHDLNAILLAAMDVAADHVRDVTFPGGYAASLMFPPRTSPAS